jgi:hypothetical protein
VAEVHHGIEAAVQRRYDPGLVTSLLYIWIGALLLISA